MISLMLSGKIFHTGAGCDRFEIDFHYFQNHLFKG